MSLDATAVSLQDEFIGPKRQAAACSALDKRDRDIERGREPRRVNSLPENGVGESGES